ncbi:FeoB-associated Cys-rich membrane protein [uncultured Kordia sp.]|nr:FeoB-associated Cys-rich membrane protein [uncultured Kordia sp.]
MIQEILVGITFLIAVGFLVKKFFWKKKTAKACGKDGCGCH